MVFRLVPHSIFQPPRLLKMFNIVVRATCRYHFGEPEIKKKKDSMFGKRCRQHQLCAGCSSIPLHVANTVRKCYSHEKLLKPVGMI